MLKVINVNHKYKKGFEVKNLSLEVKEGFIYCLLGVNGCGKTTFLRLIYGMLTGSSGEIEWNGRNVLSGGRIDEKNLAEYHREAAITGSEWCAKGLSLNKNVEILSKLYPSFDNEYFETLKKSLGLKEDADKKYMELSKGQQVKAEIAFNLAKRPKLLLLDEPLANLDPVIKMEIVEILQKAVEENEMSIIISTHLLDEVTDMVDYIILMKNGEIERFGDRIEMLENDGKTSLRELFSRE